MSSILLPSVNLIKDRYKNLLFTNLENKKKIKKHFPFHNFRKYYIVHRRGETTWLADFCDRKKNLLNIKYVPPVRWVIRMTKKKCLNFPLRDSDIRKYPFNLLQNPMFYIQIYYLVSFSYTHTHKHIFYIIIYTKTHPHFMYKQLLVFLSSCSGNT